MPAIACKEQGANADVEPGGRQDFCERLQRSKEETGFIVEPENLIALGAVYPVAGTSNEKMHLFVGCGFTQTEPQSEPTEFVKPYIMTVADFEKRILDGTFSNMYGIALWYKYLLYKKKQDWDLGGA